MGRKNKYESQVEMGERYRDARTGFEGVVTAVTFFEHACERVSLETFDRTQQTVRVEVFDAPRFVRARDEVAVTTTRTGGDRPIPGQRGAVSR